MNPGEQDITNQVVIEQFPKPTPESSQAEFLHQWGIDDLVNQGRNYWSAKSGTPDLAAMKMRSRVRESDALCGAGGLGSFSVLQWCR